MPYTYPSPWQGFGQNPNAQTPVNGLVRVTGYEGAKAYQLPPNSAMPLFDGNEDVMYVKTTDGAGFPTIKKYSFYEEPINVVASPKTETAQYVTKAEFEALAKELENAKQLISEQSDAGKQRTKRGAGSQKPDEG